MFNVIFLSSTCLFFHGREAIYKGKFLQESCMFAECVVSGVRIKDLDKQMPAALSLIGKCNIISAQNCDLLSSNWFH